LVVGQAVVCERRRTNGRIYRLLYWKRFLAPF
jgi:hypothetical protein